MEIERLTYTIPEAAKVIGVSANLAYELAAQGRIPVLRLSERRLVVPRAALLKMLEQPEVTKHG